MRIGGWFVAWLALGCGGAGVGVGMGAGGGAGAAGAAGHGGAAGRGGAAGEGGAGVLELGLGPPPFRALEAAQMVMTVTGPQGATMVVLAVRESGIEPGDPAQPSADNPMLSVRCVDQRGDLVASGDADGGGHRGLRPATAPGVYELYDVWVPFNLVGDGISNPVTCTATLADAQGRTVTDTRTLTVTFF